MPSVQLYKSKTFVLVWHLIAFTQYSYAIYYNYYFVVIPKTVNMPKMLKSGIGGHSRFLTYWCLIIQAIYFTICLINDIIGSNDVAPRNMPAIRKLKDYVLATFAFPLAINVGVSFWTLMAIDRELIFPKVFDEFFPNWLNHVMHTNIIVFILLEMCTSFRQYPKRKNGLIGLTLFMAAYLIWIHIIKSVSGVWVYPVLDVLELQQRIVFFIVILAFCLSLYFIGEFVNSKIWTIELKNLQLMKVMRDKKRLEDLARKETERERDYLLDAAYNKERLTEYTKALKYCEAVFKIEPNNREAIALEKLIKRKIVKKTLNEAAVVAGCAIFTIGALLGLENAHAKNSSKQQ